MAAMLALTRMQVWNNEQSPHRCPRAQTVLILRYQLQEPRHKEALRKAGYEHPWPGDVSS